jgi:phosphoglucosamine mutase
MSAREMVVGKLFGTDGVRGVANTQLTPELAMALGRAVVGAIGHRGDARPVIATRVPRAPCWRARWSPGS